MTTKYSPFLLLLEREPALPIDQEYGLTLLNIDIGKAQTKTRVNLILQAHQAKRFYDRSAQPSNNVMNNLIVWHAKNWVLEN